MVMQKTAVMIIAFEGFRDEEYFEPKAILENNGVKVTTASTKTGTAAGKLGAKAKVDITIEEVEIKNFDAVIFVGGPGSYQYFNNHIAFRIAKEAILHHNKVLAAICAAPGILAHAGVLSGRSATVFPAEAGLLQSKGAFYTKKSVEIDGNLITADGPKSAKQFGEAIVAKL